MRCSPSAQASCPCGWPEICSRATGRGDRRSSLRGPPPSSPMPSPRRPSPGAPRPAGTIIPSASTTSAVASSPLHSSASARSSFPDGDGPRRSGSSTAVSPWESPSPRRSRLPSRGAPSRKRKSTWSSGRPGCLRSSETRWERSLSSSSRSEPSAGVRSGTGSSSRGSPWLRREARSPASVPRRQRSSSPSLLFCSTEGSSGRAASGPRSTHFAEQLAEQLIQRLRALRRAERDVLAEIGERDGDRELAVRRADRRGIEVEILGRVEAELDLARKVVGLADDEHESARLSDLLERGAVVLGQVRLLAVPLDVVGEGRGVEAAVELPGGDPVDVGAPRDVAFEELGKYPAEALRRRQLRDEVPLLGSGRREGVGETAASVIPAPEEADVRIVGVDADLRVDGPSGEVDFARPGERRA